MISSNRRWLPSGAFGSGIFNGKTGVQIQNKFNDYNRLLIADLPIGNNSGNHQCKHVQTLKVGPEVYKEFSYVLERQVYEKDYKAIARPFETYVSKRLEDAQGTLSVCDKQTCCELQFEMNDDLDFELDDYFNYYLIAFSGENISQDPTVGWYQEICSLVIYDELTKEYKISSSTHFDKLVLRGTFNTTNIFPNVMSTDLQIVAKHRWSFKQERNEAEIALKKLKSPIALVSLFARNYDLDPNLD